MTHFFSESKSNVFRAQLWQKGLYVTPQRGTHNGPSEQNVYLLQKKIGQTNYKIIDKRNDCKYY